STTSHASYATFSKLIEHKPICLYCALYVSPVKRIDKYCYPIRTLIPIEVNADATITELTFFNDFSIADNNFGTMPNVNNNPPKLNANSTITIVKNILSIPPRVNNSSISSTPVLEVNPSNSIPNKSANG